MTSKVCNLGKGLIQGVVMLVSGIQSVVERFILRKCGNYDFKYACY